jgi:hypothetical protein
VAAARALELAARSEQWGEVPACQERLEEALERVNAELRDALDESTAQAGEPADREVTPWS